MSAPIIWNGNFAKTLRSLINLADQLYLLNGTVDPTVVAQNAPQGSVYCRVGGSGGTLYLKQDAGSSTNWSLVNTFTIVPVTSGGTGLATLTLNNVILGNGTSTPQFVAPSTSGNVLMSDGTTWLSGIPNGPFTPNSFVRNDFVAGNASTNTVIRYWNNITASGGTDITYTNDSVLGDTWVINTTGIYAISYTDGGAVGTGIGLSLNSAQLTTSVFSITALSRLACQNPSSGNEVENLGWTGYLAVNDVIRCHTDGSAPTGAPSRCSFSIYRIL